MRIGITQGDTNGIGLEIIIKALAPEGMTDLFTPVIFANKKLMQQTISAIRDINLKFQTVESAADARDGKINLVNIGQHPVTPEYGVPTSESGQAAYQALATACEALEDGEIDALVTAPISKEAIQNDNFKFPGHTEFLQHRFTDGDDSENDSKALMILFNDNLRIALLTTHLPLSQVSNEVRTDRIIDAVKRFDHSLRRDFGCDRPKIAVLSLNPHCGDGGLLGDEEQREIIPAINHLRDENLMVFGPYAADGFFGSGQWHEFDGVLAIYHDQGLAPFKTIAGGSGVNFTSGLDIVRTSPDHGVAYDIAGQMRADATSMREAIYKAIDITRSRERYDEATANPLPIATHKSSNKPQ